MPRGRRGRSRKKKVVSRSRSRSRARTPASQPRRPLKRRKPLALQQHSFCERAETTHLLAIGEETGTYAAVGHFQDFSLSKMRNAAEYAALFEQYRIDKVVVTFRYKGGKAGVATNPGTTWNESNPLLYFKVDHDDSAAQTLEQLKDSMKTRTHMFTNDNPEFSIQLRPAVLIEILKSAGGTTVTSPKWGVWLNTTDDGVIHNGLKCFAVGYKSGSYNPGSLSMTYKYYVSFKNNE